MIRKRTRIVHLKQVTLKKVLGVFDIFAVSYGDLGSSIFYALGIVAFYALGLTPIALGAAGFVFVCTALTYAELTAMIHEAGGAASFSRYAFNDLFAFIAGWGLLLDYIVTITISAFTVSPYLAYFFSPFAETDIQMISSIVIIALLFFLNVVGVKQSTRFSLVLTGTTLLVEIVIIALGFAIAFNISTLIDHFRIGVAHAAWSPSWPEFWKGVAMAMVAFTGVETVAQLGGESTNPKKTPPRALMLTMVALLFVFLSLSSIAVTVVPPHVLGTTYEMHPIAGMIKAFPMGGQVLGPSVAIIAAIVLIVASNAGLIGASRLTYNMGEYYLLPRFFARLLPRFRTPAVALGFFALVSIALIIASLGQLSFLADLYNFGAMINYFSAHVALLVLRVKKPFWERPFRLRLSIPFGRFGRLPITAIVGALSTLAVWGLVIVTKPIGRWAGFTWMVLGIAMYVWYRRKKKIKPAGHVAIEQIKIPGFRAIKYHRILLPLRLAEQTDTMQMASEIAQLHKAKLTVLHVLDVPHALPLDAQLFERATEGELILKRAEAIARDFHVDVEMKMLRARSVVNAILDLAKKGNYDLIVLSATYLHGGKVKERLGGLVAEIVRRAPCRVWVCQ